MKKTLIYALIALTALAGVIVCVKQFLATGNGLWAIWAVLGCAVKAGAVADAIELHMSGEFLDRIYGKGGRYE